MMEITQFAPVLIPTLNRYEHFHRCVESLSKCTHADKTDLYIALDYPANDSHWEGYNKIKEYLNEISGFKSLNIIQRDKNFGATQNIIDAREQVFQKYDRIILSEDDNEFAPNFLDYINKGLDKFENDHSVLAICGFSYPIKIPKSYNYNHYFSKVFSAWGYGIWKSKYDDIDWSINNIKKFLKNPFNIWKIKYVPYDLLFGLFHIIKTGIITGDRVFAFNNFLHNTYSVFPTISTVKNWGNDGSGIHCKVSKLSYILQEQKLDKEKTFCFDNIKVKEDKNIKKSINKHFKSLLSKTIKKRLKRWIKIIYFYMCILFNKY